MASGDKWCNDAYWRTSLRLVTHHYALRYLPNIGLVGVRPAFTHLKRVTVHRGSVQDKLRVYFCLRCPKGATVLKNAEVNIKQMLTCVRQHHAASMNQADFPNLRICIKSSFSTETRLLKGIGSQNVCMYRI